ncbi:hypothetical protein [Allomuricauda sp. SCSIO 65647]|uniref:hypothetical protein n=1 Tax=Allomuricauda sp. SCSIO 65647 TaxID=2908843 RepID=UPI001F28EBC0|nr:hypothetical protein [Muricauda sp. SCSIO 65647]UJH66233.1 hypothetical protein L0P89_09635 [Muricauda sp. SCSIO 65647]
MSSKSIFFLLGCLSFSLCSCQNPGKLDVITDLPSSLSENSGIVSYDGKTIWLIEDSGNNDNIFHVDFNGKIIKHLDLKNAKNKDWEDLTKDHYGNLYVGDFGNNENHRENLVIYKLPNPEQEKGDKIKSEKIEFRYPEQKKFPPKKSKLYYDAEAFFHWGNSLYIITKNRTRPYDGKAMIYKVPDTKGSYEAELIGEWFLCNDQNRCSATAATISPDGKTIAVLGYGTLWLITDFEFDHFYKGSVKQIDLGLRTQLEAICFIGHDTLLLSDERSRATGGNLYRLQLSKILKPEPNTKGKP